MKVGDKVIVKMSEDNQIPKGEIGIIISTDGFERKIGVEFKREIGGAHSLNGRTTYGNGYWFHEEELKLKRNSHICRLICNCNSRKAMLL